MPVSLLDRAIYTYGDVDRLVGLPPGTGKRWLEGYRRKGRFYEPLLRSRPTGASSVTWGEMVEARLLAEFRSKGVPCQRLRPAIVRLREEFGPYPLARSRPFLEADGRELVRVIQDETNDLLELVVVRNNQLVLAETTESFRSAVDYDGGVAVSLRPSRKALHVVMNPDHALGQPAIRNVRTASLAEDFRAGTTREELAELYELTPQQVDDAIRFELMAGSRRVA